MNSHDSRVDYWSNRFFFSVVIKKIQLAIFLSMKFTMLFFYLIHLASSMKIICVPSQIVNKSPFIISIAYKNMTPSSTICVQGLDESHRVSLESCKIVLSNHTCDKLQCQMISNEGLIHKSIKWNIYSSSSTIIMKGDTNGFDNSTVGDFFLYNYPCQHCQS